MKKSSYLLFATMLACSSVFVSCDGDDKEPGNDGILDYPYSSLSTEEQKEKLQEDALAFLSEIEGLKQEKGAAVLAEFSRLLEISEPENSNLDSSDDLVYEDVYGKYQWDAGKEKWVYSELKTGAEFIFPFERETATIVVTPSDPVTIQNGGDEDEGVKIPRNVEVTVRLASKVVASIKASSEITGLETVPANTSLAFTYGVYATSFNATKGTSNVVTATLKKGEKSLIDASINASGNMDNLLSEDDKAEPGNIAGNVMIKINGTLAVAGKADITKYIDAIDAAEEIYNKIGYGPEAEETFAQAEAKAFNDFVELYLVSLSDNTTIARLVNEVKTVDSWSHTVLAFQFGDNTTTEVEVYFGEEFEDIIEKFQNFIAELENLVEK